MLLHYVWIKEFNNIHEQGFSFSDKYIFRYDDYSQNFIIRKNDNQISNFFEDNLLSVTGIIGANGSGKTSCLDFLKLRLGSFTYSGWFAFANDDLAGIFVFENQIFCHKAITISNLDDLKDQGFEIFYYDESLGKIYIQRNDASTEYDFANPFIDNAYIFYSNIFDLKTEPHLFELLDISTNSLVFNDKYSNPRYAKEDHTKINFESLIAYRIQEIKRQLDFIIKKQTSLPFPYPNHLSMRLEENYNNFLQKDYDWFENNKLKALQDSEMGFFNSFDRRSEDQTELKKIYKAIFLYKLIKVLSIDQPTNFQRFDVFDFQSFIHQEDLSPFDKIEFIDQLDNLKKMLTTFKSILENGKVYKKDNYDGQYKTLWEIYDTLHLDLNADMESALFEFLLSFNALVKDKTFLAFFWQGFSSGQLNMLTLFSRFNSIVDNSKIQNSKHIVVMIDEGETYFHPAWQRDYLKIVINYMKSLFNTHTLQIIITSNSPFIASDIPKSMINFLDRDKQDNCVVVDGLNQNKETFGANIHTLYSDAFFMENLLIGSFAKDKIDRLIKIINKEEPFNDEFPDWSTVQKYIEIIGEPILKSLLQKQLDNQYNY